MFGIDDAISAVSNLASTVVERIWPDATEVEKAKLQKITAEMQGEFALLLGQLDINKIEAGSRNIFVSGWRPAIGWICGMALGYSAIVEPMARFVSTVYFDYQGEFPSIDTSLTQQVLLGLLGLAGMRTYEKKHGLTK